MTLCYSTPIGHIKSQESHVVVALGSLVVKALLVVPVAFDLLKCSYSEVEFPLQGLMAVGAMSTYGYQVGPGSRTIHGVT